MIIATILLLAGFGYYVYHTAQRKGWFLTKLRYHTFVQSAAGLHEGDPIVLLGFEVGQVTRITAMPPFSTYGNIYIEFVVREPFYGYIWTDSYVKLTSAGFLGNRSLEVVPGGTTGTTNLHASYRIENDKILGVWDVSGGKYVPYTPASKGYSFSPAEETPVVTAQLEELTSQAQRALPGILNLTNDLARVLTNAAQLTAHADGVIQQAQPILANLSIISGALTNGRGALGDWAIPTNINAQLELTLSSATATLNTANTNVATLATSLTKTLDNLAGITGSLNAQVQTNDQILGSVSAAIVHADELVQGLKRHWLLRSAFKNAPTGGAASPTEPKSPADVQTSPWRAPADPKSGKRVP